MAPNNLTSNHSCTSTSTHTQTQTPPISRKNARQRQAEVALLVEDILRSIPPLTLTDATTLGDSEAVALQSKSSASNSEVDEFQREEAERYNELMQASTVAAALERNLDRELYAELTAKGKEASTLITRICNDHSDDFLGSVGRLVSLGLPVSASMPDLLSSNSQNNTRNSSATSAAELKSKIEAAGTELTSDVGTGGTMLIAATKLETRKEAYRKARAMKTLIGECHKVAIALEHGSKYALLSRPRAALDAVDEARAALKAPITNPLVLSVISPSTTLEGTPFGQRANDLLPKIENEVLAGARKGLARWFLNIRGGDGAKAGAAALRKCALSQTIGASSNISITERFEWKLKNTDNLIARGDGRVAAAARKCANALALKRDTKRLEMFPEGMARRAEAIATAFGWYQCWKEDTILNLEASVGGIKSAVTSSSNRKFSSGANKRKTQWAVTLTPPLLFEDSHTRAEEEEILRNLVETTYPVHRAKATFTLLGKSDEFRSYYEQNRFGDMKIQGGKGASDLRSSLSSLTGDDVSVGTDRFFNAKILPHLCASIVGFSAVESALELGIFDETETDEIAKRSLSFKPQPSEKKPKPASTIASTQYERALIAELGLLIRSRAQGATLAELARASFLMSSMRAALRLVYPSSATRRFDKELLAMDNDMVMTGLKICYDEQKAAAMRAALDDRFDPMIRTSARQFKEKSGYEDLIDFPFGLNNLYHESSICEKMDALDPSLSRHKNNATVPNLSEDYGKYSFSQCVPSVLRSIHARVITYAVFVKTQEELGQKFPPKKGAGASGYVLDCLEECIKASAVSLKERVEDEQAEVEIAIQMTANISSLLATLPRLFGVIFRGICHIGLAKGDAIEETFAYADDALKRAENECENEYGALYSMVYEISRNRIDTLINFSLENMNWIARTVRDTPNAYADNLIEFLKGMFASLTPLDEGSRAGIQFSCCGHIAERLVRLLTLSPSDTNEEEGLAPIGRIDAYALKNLSIDIKAFKDFTNSLDVPQLVECFAEIDRLVSAMLDRDLPMLLQPENAAVRAKKYPFLSLEKLACILEKYTSASLGSKFLSGAGGNMFSSNDTFLMLEKKEINNLLKLIKEQT